MRRASERSSSPLAHFSTHSGYPSSHPRGYSTHPANVSSHLHPYTHRPYRKSSPYDDHAAVNSITSHASGRPRAHTEDANGPALSQWRGRSSSPHPFSSDHVSEPGSRSMLLQSDNGFRNALSFLGDSHIGGSSSSLNTIGPSINHENPQLRPYSSSTALQSNGHLSNASFMTSPSYDSSLRF
jgi:hypothetical protein